MYPIAVVGLSTWALFTVLTLALVIPAQALAWPFDPLRRVSARIARWSWGRCMFLAQPFWRTHITGLERLSAGPCVVVANHQSMLDIPLLLSLPIDLRVVARAGVLKIPVYGFMARFGGHVIVDGDAPERGLQHAIDLLRSGVSVAVFPEGQRSADGTLQAFQRGAFELALRAGVPVQAVAIRDTGVALPKGRFFGEQVVSRIELEVLAPAPARGTRRELSRLARDAIAATLARPHPFHVESAVAARYRPLGRFREGFARGKTRYDPVYRLVLARIPARCDVLDLGAGEGLLGAYLAAAGAEGTYRGIDVDAARALVARKAGLDVKVLDLAAAPPGALGDADVVTLLDVLHYFPVDVQDRVLAVAAAAVRPGGMLIVRDPEPGRGLGSWWTVMSERVFVATGRHAGQEVKVRGGAAIAARVRALGLHADVEDGSRGTPFSNALVTARRPPG